MKQIDIHDKNQVSALLAKFSNKKSATTLQNAKLDKSNVNVTMNFDSKKTVKLEPSVELVFENVDGLGVMTIISDKANTTKTATHIMATNQTIKNSGTKEFNSYGMSGYILFTVTQEYCFTIKNPSGRGVVTCDYGRGYIAPGFLSMWTGNVWTNTYTNKVETYGTASWSVPLANLIGVNVNIQSINYTAFTTCDPMGEVSSTITFKHN